MSNRTPKDLAAKRLERMHGLLRERRIMSVSDLSAALDVSAATVRRDLATLERGGTVQRVHGGAVCRGSALDEPLFDDKASLAAREKRRIAEAAAGLVSKGDSIFLDGGSTILALALLLRSRTDITIVTNSLRVAIELAGGGPRLIMIGGELRPLSQTFVGPLTRWILDRVQTDIAFIGATGLTPEAGMTTTDPGEAFTKDLIISRARRAVLLTDSTKIGRVSFTSFGVLKRLEILITDGGITAAARRAFRKRGLKIMTV